MLGRQPRRGMCTIYIVLTTIRNQTHTRGISTSTLHGCLGFPYCTCCGTSRGTLSCAGGTAAITEKPALSGPGAADEPAGVSDSLSALSLSGQEAMNTLNTLCKSAAAEGALGAPGLCLPGADYFASSFLCL